MFRKEWIKEILGTLTLLFLFSPLGAQLAEPVMLPNGWRLTPAGKQLPLGDLPLNMAVSPNRHWLAVTNNGYGRQCIQLFDTRKEVMTSDITIRKSWYGLCFSPDNKTLYASGGNENTIHIYNVSDKGILTHSDSIVMGKPWPHKISPTGIVVIPRKNQLCTVTKHDFSLYVYDLSDKHLIKKVPLGGEGYDILLSKDEKKVYVSCWACEKVRIWDVDKMEWVKDITVGSHPNEMCLDNRSQRLFVANADDNSVSVINLKTEAVEETLNAALFPHSLSGSTTNGLAITPNGKTLAIANADNNCLNLFDISKLGQSKSLGFIPVGWYPTNVKCIGKKLWVTNGKGLRSMPNPKGPQPADKRLNYEQHRGDANKVAGVQYIGGMLLGALSIIDMPDATTLQKYTGMVYHNTPYQKNTENKSDSEKDNPIPSKLGNPSPIKYVFYVIKENRTYDQVLGDMKEGNGDSTLVLFDRHITPNLHAIAKQFVLLDNFYVDAEVSCDGHNWTMGAYANDYLEKTWPSYYSHRGDYFSGEGLYPMANNKSGFIWDICQKKGVSYRSYGEFVFRSKGVIKETIPSLKDKFCTYFEPWNLGVRDTVRFNEFKQDFDSLLQKKAVPHFITVRMGGDHTEGMRAGRPTPYAHAADNDLAVGLLVDYLSHTPIWKETAIFVIEDDAQNGADHVDAHRSTAYVAGGFVKRGYVDHTPYTTSSMLRTMELILGLPPMTQYDSGARVMWRCFSPTADLTPFKCLPNEIPLDEINEKTNSRWQAMSENYDFKKEDNVPDVEFNQVLWHGLKGSNVAYPPIRRSAFLTYSATDDDDD
jgi:YVTN family beta-propeller protein